MICAFSVNERTFFFFCVHAYFFLRSGLAFCSMILIAQKILLLARWTMTMFCNVLFNEKVMSLPDIYVRKGQLGLSQLYLAIYVGG